MGIWGPAVFSDDVAGDVRDAYRQRVADGMDGVDATDELIKDWLDDRDADDPDTLVFWLALAATQSKVGRLEDRVRDKAIEIIDNGQDLERWEEEGLTAKRAKHLEKLRTQLTGPQPNPKKIRVERFYVPDFKAGNYVSFEMSTGEFVIFFIDDVADDGVCLTLLDWRGKELPSLDEIKQLPRKTCGSQEVIEDFHVHTMKKKGIPHSQLTVLDIDDDRDRRQVGPGTMWWWENLEFFVNELTWKKPGNFFPDNRWSVNSDED
ncbi:MAG: hypothetical protein CMJ78_19785 [Planctomycetaceae bacterium]|nr:hypothetical protein [Planctomycetaceae bacterium]